MRYAVISFGVLVAGCSTASPALDPGPELPASVQVTGLGMEVRLSRDDRAIGGVAPVALDAAWDALVKAYQEMDVPLDTRVSGGGVLATEPFRAPRQLLGQPLGTFLDCGSSIAGTRVRIWQVTAQLATGLEEAEDGVLVSTRLTASARPSGGSSTNAVGCSSTGKLEQEIVLLVGEGADAT